MRVLLKILLVKSTDSGGGGGELSLAESLPQVKFCRSASWRRVFDADGIKNFRGWRIQEWVLVEL